MYQLLLDAAGAKAGFLMERVVHRLGGVEVGIHSNEVHQPEGPHLETTSLYQFVNRLVVCHAFLQQLKALRIKWSGYTVHNKTRAVLCHHGLLAHALGYRLNCLGNSRIGCFAGDHLHQLHDVHGIEEVHAYHPFGLGICAASWVMGMEEVLEAKMVLGSFCAASFWKNVDFQIQLFDHCFNR